MKSAIAYSRSRTSIVPKISPSFTEDNINNQLKLNQTSKIFAHKFNYSKTTNLMDPLSGGSFQKKKLKRYKSLKTANIALSRKSSNLSLKNDSESFDPRNSSSEPHDHEGLHELDQGKLVRSSNKKESMISSLSMDNSIASSEVRNHRRNGVFIRTNSKRGRNNLKFIILPDSKFKFAWQIYTLILILYASIVIPFRMAFLEEYTVGFWKILDILIDASFLVDIVLQFFMAYTDLDDNIITDRKKIAINYIVGWFAMDIVSGVPFSFFDLTQDNASQSRYGKLLKISRFPKLVRLGRLIKVSRIFKLLKNKRGMFKMMKINSRAGNVLYRLCLTLFSCLLICHLASCIWCISATYNDEDPENWLLRLGYVDKTLYEKYLVSFYWVIQTVFSVGYGDISAFTIYEQLVACIWMFAGVFVYSFFIGSFSTLFTSMDHSRIRIKQMLGILQRIKKEYSIGDEIYKKTRNIIKVGSDFTAQDYTDFLAELPYDIQMDLSYQIYSQELKNVQYFIDKPQSFIAVIGSCLKPLHVKKGDYVYMQDDAADEIFFIKKGTISGCLPQHNNYEFIDIRQGYYFGEIELLRNADKRQYTFLAKDDCELLLLNKKKFKQIFLMQFRELGENMIKNAILREVRIKSAHQEGMLHCSSKSNRRIRRSTSKETYYKGDISEDEFDKEIEKSGKEKDFDIESMQIDKILNDEETISQSQSHTDKYKSSLLRNVELNQNNQIHKKVNFLEALKQGISHKSNQEKNDAKVEIITGKIAELTKIVDEITKFLKNQTLKKKKIMVDASCQTDRIINTIQKSTDVADSGYSTPKLRTETEMVTIRNDPEIEKKKSLSILIPSSEGEFFDERTLEKIEFVESEIKKTEEKDEFSESEAKRLQGKEETLEVENKTIPNRNLFLTDKKLNNSETNILDLGNFSSLHKFALMKSKSIAIDHPGQKEIVSEGDSPLKLNDSFSIKQGDTSGRLVMRRSSSKEKKEAFSPSLKFNKEIALKKSIDSRKISKDFLTKSPFIRSTIRRQSKFMTVNLTNIHDQKEKEKIVDDLFDEILK